MNKQAAEALYDAERRGVKQIKFALEDGHGGRCAMGVLYAAGLETQFLATRAVAPCPLCGVTKQQSQARYPLDREGRLIVHFNNDHGLTFSEIARKLGPDHV